MPFEDDQDDAVPILPHDSEDFAEEEDEEDPTKHGMHIEGEEDATVPPEPLF